MPSAVSDVGASVSVLGRPLSDQTADDYDSPVSEAGEHGYHSGTDKYMAMQAVLKKYASPAELVPEPPLPARTGYGAVKMTSVAPLLPNLKVLAPTAAATATATTPAAETLGPACHYGMMLYSKTLTASDLLGLEVAGSGGLSISAGGLRDRAQIFVDGIEMGTVSSSSSSSIQMMFVLISGPLKMWLVCVKMWVVSGAWLDSCIV